LRAIAEQLVDVPVAGGNLRAAVWGDGGPVVLAAHGITASSVSWRAVAERLAGRVRLVAPDLRGRGHSAALPGPYGMSVHASDMVAVLDFLDAESAVVAGHSMGGYVAVVLAGRHPQRVRSLVLVDGGLPSPVPVTGDVDAILDATLGPAIARLSQTFASADAYRDFWRAHPALAEDWSDLVEAYVDYDLSPELRSRVSEAAVRADGASLLQSSDVPDAFAKIRCPITLLRAPRGLMNEATPLIPDALVAHWREALASLDDTMVPDVNHYTIALSARGADVVADAIAKGAGL
jgi:pimeloyl-ACP methyl ester carboxylesterase